MQSWNSYFKKSVLLLYFSSWPYYRSVEFGSGSSCFHCALMCLQCVFCVCVCVRQHSVCLWKADVSLSLSSLIILVYFYLRRPSSLFQPRFPSHRSGSTFLQKAFGPSAPSLRYRVPCVLRRFQASDCLKFGVCCVQ